MRLILATLFAAMLAALPVRAADVTVIHAGKLIDVEKGQVLKDQMITVEGDRITAVAPWHGAPAGAKILDWSSRTVLPGLMDMHTHISDYGDSESNNPLEPLMHSAAESALSGVKNARNTLLAGFTTIRDVGPWHAFTDVAIKNAINNGTIIGPRMSVVGAYITVPGGAGAITGQIPDVGIPADMRFGVVRNADEVREKVRTLIQHGATFIKTLATGAVLTNGTEPGAPELSEEELHAAVVEASHYGIYVASHAHGAEGIKNAVRAGVRSIEHGSLIDDEGIALMKKHGTWLVADIYNGDYIGTVGRAEHWPEEQLRKNDETTEAQREGFRKAVKAGVKIAYGTDAGVYPHGLNGRQMAYMVKWGMTPMQAIRSATLSAAELLGWEKKVGSIAPGKYADIIAVDGDLMKNVRLVEHVAAVMKGGVLYKEDGKPTIEAGIRHD
ncbi:metal-dependent hydrolase family protein [Kordiimonas marina]|uniref:Xaa-Pro dipeptidase n=1 Tax=Kordiimonas marina TaxID=2872312 RepID=UPI001FF55C5C|nr:amidohydrolase family protein [Kordiimonas marina]MCJ9430652.1 amidohydrolase family protein [Kordiimonas marina]